MRIQWVCMVDIIANVLQIFNIDDQLVALSEMASVLDYSTQPPVEAAPQYPSSGPGPPVEATLVVHDTENHAPLTRQEQKIPEKGYHMFRKESTPLTLPDEDSNVEIVEASELAKGRVGKLERRVSQRLQ